MNFLFHSKTIISFELDSNHIIHHPNGKFGDEFPEYKSQNQIPLQSFLKYFPNPTDQFEYITTALKNGNNEIQIQLSADKNLNLEIARNEQGISLLYGCITFNKTLIDHYISNLERVQLSGDGIILGNAKGLIIYINQKITEFTGYPEHELLNQHISILFPKDELHQKPLRFDILDSNKEYLARRRLLRKDGSEFYIEMLSKKVKDGYITNIRNIEERVKIENELEEIRKRHVFVTQLEKIGIIDQNLNNGQVVFNSEMNRILDVKQATLTYNDWVNMIHPDDTERVLEGINMVKESGNTFNFVYRLNTNFKTKTIRSSADILYSENSKCQKLIISSIDISDSNELKTKLLELQQTFKALTNTESNAIFIYRKKFLYTNSGFEKISGYNSKEILNMKFWDIIHPDHVEIVKERGLKRISGESANSHYDFKIITKSGEVKWLDLSASTIKYMGHYAAIGSALDITNRKKMEEELKENIENLEEEKHKVEESERRFRNYIEHNTAAMLAVDIKTKKILFANHSASEMYGYSQDEFKTLKVYDIQTLGKEEIDFRMRDAITKSSNEFVFEHRKKNGDIFHVRINVSLIKTQTSSTLVLIINDIDEDVKNKKQLIESHATYKNILNSISEMLYILNEKGEFIYVNQASIDTYQYSFGEIIGKTPEFLSAPGKNNLKEVENKLKEAYNGNQNTILFWGLRKDKTIFPKEVVLSPGYYFSQKVVIAVSRDITEHLKITEELTMAKEKAEESDKLKSAFLANMSHEIRTPMNAILGFSELIKDQDMEQEERIKFINIINRSSHHLLDLIDDLVDMSKIYSNQMPLYEDKMTLNSVFFEIYEFFETKLISDERHQELKISISFGLPYGKDIIKTDETRFRQILNNLIGNAIKFTKKGHVHFEYTMEENELLFKVEDTGIGIAESQLKNVFNRFVQGDQKIGKEYGGTGLGLAISQACVEMLGGKIWIESKLNVGTTIYFTLPYNKIEVDL